MNPIDWWIRKLGLGVMADGECCCVGECWGVPASFLILPGVGTAKSSSLGRSKGSDPLELGTVGLEGNLDYPHREKIRNKWGIWESGMENLVSDEACISKGREEMMVRSAPKEQLPESSSTLFPTSCTLSTLDLLLSLLVFSA